MRISTIEMTVVENEEGKQNGATIAVNGSYTALSKGICGLLQSDIKFRMMVMEAIINAIGGTIKVENIHSTEGGKEQ